MALYSLGDIKVQLEIGDMLITKDEASVFIGSRGVVEVNNSNKVILARLEEFWDRHSTIIIMSRRPISNSGRHRQVAAHKSREFGNKCACCLGQTWNTFNWPLKRLRTTPSVSMIKDNVLAVYNKKPNWRIPDDIRQDNDYFTNNKKVG